MDYDKTWLVTKSNFLIEACYRLNILEQKIISILVAQIQPKDEDFRIYRLRVKELFEFLEVKDDKKYTRVREATRKLVSRCLTLKDKVHTTQLAWLASAKYYEKEGIVELRFLPELKPYLLQLKDRFSSYKLLYTIKLKSNYSFRIYELLKQYESLHARSFELAHLRYMLGLAENQYKVWKDFKVNVLDVATKEVSEKTDISVDFTFRKKGRAVAFIDFVIKTKKQECPCGGKKEAKDIPILERTDEDIKIGLEKLREIRASLT